MSPQVFLSHSSRDVKITETICLALEKRGIACWHASRDVHPGENFMQAIVRAIRGAKVMVLVFIVVIIGGLGSVKGALIGALLIGLADTFGKILVPEIAGMSVYLVMATVLLLRPAGLFGRA